jgi:hypothetical protein
MHFFSFSPPGIEAIKGKGAKQELGVKRNNASTSPRRIQTAC